MLANVDPLPVWRAPWQFAVHTIVGSSIFGIIAVPAVALDIGIERLLRYGMSDFVVYALTAGEYALLTTDLCLFAVFLWRTARRIIPHL
jgi:hypothetical protein